MKGIKFIGITLLTASLLVFAGCNKAGESSAAEQSSATGVETGVKQAKLAKPDAMLFNTKTVAGYAALSSLDGFKKMAADMMAKFQFLPAAMVPAMIDDGIKGPLQVQSLEWLDGSRPIVTVFGDLREQQDEGLLCMPLASKALFEKSLPPSVEKDQDGNQYKTIDPMGQPSYMNVLGDSHVVLTPAANVFGKYEKLLQRDLAKVKPERTIEVVIRGEGVRSLTRGELDAAKKELEKAVDTPEVKEELEKAGLQRDQAMKLFAMIEEIRTVEFRAYVTEGRFILQTDLSANDGTTLGNVLSTQAKGDIESLLGLIPADAYFASAALGVTGSLLKELGLNQAQLGGTAGLISEVFDQKLPKDTAKELEEALQEAVDGYSDRPTVGFLYKSGTSPLAFVNLTLDPSAVESQKKLEKVFAVLWKGLAQVIIADAGEVPPGVVVDPTSFSKSFESIKGLAAPFGVTLSKSVKAGTNGVTVDGYRAKVAYEALPDYEASKAELNAVKGLLGDTFEVALGSSKDRLGSAFGPAAVEDLNQFLTRAPSKLGAKDTTRLKAGYSKTSLFARIDAIEFLQSIQKVAPAGLLPPGTNVPSSGGQGGMVVMFGSSKANTAGIVLDLPLGDIAALIRAFNISPM